MSDKTQVSRKFIVIGASAGGLTPLSELIKALKIDNSTSVIVVMHMSASHNSYLPEILSKLTKYPVTKAIKGDKVETKHIYVAPAEQHLIIDDFHFKFINDETSPQPNINMLLESVANLNAVIPIGVLLSGNGSDGTRGLLSVKSQGGLTYVQEPNTADYDSMPNAAIESDAADFQLSADEIGRSISMLIEKNQFPDVNSLCLDEGAGAGISNILDFLYSERQIDLHNYKATSLRRRIYRRVALGGFTGVREYLSCLKQNSTELEALINDIFISVTQFMRDSEIWKKLRQLVTDYIKTNKIKLLRVWSIGCSTGEEAYSWAIILEDIKSELNSEFDYIIFATDISERSIEQARRGIYDISEIDLLDPHLVQRYFTTTQYGYQVDRYIRDKIVFSIHNLLLDPPFSNIDFLSCRNVLIYFNQKLQKRALANFGYSLVKKGYLILGTSESVGQKPRYFIDYAKEEKIFQRTNTTTSQHGFSHSFQNPKLPLPRIINKQKHENHLLHIIQSKIAEHSGYSALLVDDKDDILFTFGNADPLLNLKPGQFSQCVFDYLDDRFRASLRALVLKCRRTNQPVNHTEKINELGVMLYAVMPVSDSDNWLVIILNKIDDQDIKNNDGASLDINALSGSKLIHELEDELNSTKMALHTVVEELEQTNDALQSSNEELQSSNEELQATNEELQTTNEELQSSNEELRTVNDELRLKNIELNLVSTHLQNVEENLETPYILLSRKLEVIRFSKTIDLISRTDALEINDTLEDIPWLRPDVGLKKHLAEVAKAVLEDRQSRSLSGYKIYQHRYDIAVKHYTDDQNRCSEIMLVFSDVTQRFEQTELALGNFKKREHILSLLETGLIYTDVNGIIKYANPQASRYLCDAEDIFIGKHIDRVFYAFLTAESKYPVAGFFQKMTDNTFDANAKDNPIYVVRNENGIKTIRLNISPSIESNNITNAWLFEVHDLTHETELSLQIEYVDTHDTLTGLQNRFSLEQRILAFNNNKTEESTLTYALIDVDHFKPINEVAGHLCGDEALKLIALNILQCIREQDLLTRIGGDEYALLLVDLSKEEAIQALKAICKRIDALELETAEGLLNVSVSIGWSFIEGKSEISISELYSYTDEALYLAKQSGGNCLREISTEDANQHHSISAITFEKIKFAFKHDRVSFGFQPIVGLKQNASHYFELLVRINDGDQLMNPAAFMPVVERYNFTRRFDNYVFRHALTQISKIQKSTTEPLNFAINLSASAIEHSDVFDTLADFPHLIGSRSIGITLEITETAAIKDLFQAKRFIERAQNLGLKVSLDDFGVGFNGFHYLKELKVNTVKIDGSFINGIVENEVDRIFVQSVISLSKVLKFNVVAEFVDSQEKLDLIRKMGFHYSQGYLHAKPLRIDEFYRYLND